MAYCTNLFILIFFIIGIDRHLHPSLAGNNGYRCVLCQPVDIPIFIFNWLWCSMWYVLAHIWYCFFIREENRKTMTRTSCSNNRAAVARSTAEAAAATSTRLNQANTNQHKHAYSHSFFGDSVGSFFPSRPQYAILGTEFSVKSLRSSAVFGGRLKRPSPWRIRSAPGRDRVRGLSETIEKCANFCILGGICPSYSWILAYAELERKKHTRYGKQNISKLASFPIWLLISSPPHLLHSHTSKRLAYFAHRTTDCCVVAFRHRISRLNTFVRAFIVFEGGRSLPSIITPSVRADSPSERDTTYYFVVRLWDRVNQTIAINQGIKQVEC